MATTVIKAEAKETKIDSSFGVNNVRIMEMRLVAQNKSQASINNPNDKRTEDIKAPFSEIVQMGASGNLDDLVR